jgi:hypothetical protein
MHTDGLGHMIVIMAVTLTRITADTDSHRISKSPSRAYSEFKFRDNMPLAGPESLGCKQIP